MINYVEHRVKSTIKYPSSLLNTQNNCFNKLFGSIGKFQNILIKIKLVFMTHYNLVAYDLVCSYL